MTRAEAIMILKNEQPHCGKRALFPEEKKYEAYDVAIKALEQQTCEDAVSRAAVLDIFADNADATRPYSTAWEEVKALPPVNPQHTDEEIQKMQDLEQAEIQKAYEIGKTEGQNSEDVISRQAVLDAMYALCDTGETLKENPWRDNPHIDAVVETIEQLPSVNPQRTGHWIQTQEKDDAEPFILWECSCCHKEFRGVIHKVSNYCPNCGCRIVEPQESEVEG